MQINARVIRRANVRLRRDAHFAHLVHICTQQLIVHILVRGIEFSTAPIYHITCTSLCSLWSSRCLSPMLFYHLSLMEKSLCRARTFRTVTPPHFSPFIPPLHLFSVCLFVARQRRRNGEERRGESNPPIHLADNP